MQLLWLTGSETVLDQALIIAADKTQYWKLINKFNVMYSDELFLRRRIYKYLEKSKILNGANNLGIFVIVCIPPPEFTFLWNYFK